MKGKKTRETKIQPTEKTTRAPMIDPAPIDPPLIEPFIQTPQTPLRNPTLTLLTDPTLTGLTKGIKIGKTTKARVIKIPTETLKGETKIQPRGAIILERKANKTQLTRGLMTRDQVKGRRGRNHGTQRTIRQDLLGALLTTRTTLTEMEPM